MRGSIMKFADPIYDALSADCDRFGRQRALFQPEQRLGMHMTAALCGREI